jgi:hypothetical protein
MFVFNTPVVVFEFYIDDEASDHPADPLTTLKTINDSPPC